MSRPERPPRGESTFQAITSAPLASYALAVVVVVLLSALRASLGGELEDRSRFLLFLPGAVLISWLAGVGPGLLTLVGGALAGVLVLPATGERFAAHPGDLLSAVLYLISGAACIGIVQDLRRTQRKLQRLNLQLEERVRERTADLDRALRDMQGFTYAVAHNMRSPLRAIVGYGRIMQEDSFGRLDSGAASHLARIDRSARHMSRLIDDLLGYARLCVDDSELDSVDVSSMADDIVRQVLKEHGLCEATVTIAPGLTAWADRRHLWSALDEIIDNSVKYRSPDRELRLDVRGENGSMGCSLIVEDNGIGFEMRYAEKVFQPFERLHGDADYSGTGIGLAIVARIVEKHHGSVRIESEPGKGTIVCLSLPVPNRPITPPGDSATTG